MRTVAFTRPRDRLERSEAAARSLGMRPLAAPSLKVLPGDADGMDAFLADLARGRMDAAVFASTTAVDVCASAAGDLAGLLRGVIVIAIGRATRDRLLRLGAEMVMMPSAFTSEGLVEDCSPLLRGRRTVLLRSDKGTPLLREGLEAEGCIVSELHAYRLEPEPLSDGVRRIAEEAAAGKVDGFAFSSALSARTFMEQASQLLGEDEALRAVSAVAVAAIGPPTAHALEDVGVAVDLIASEADFERMLEELKAFLER